MESVKVRREPVAFERHVSNLRVFGARIAGVTPLLMHNPKRSIVPGRESRINRKETPTPEEEAEQGLYRHPEERWLCLHYDHVYQSMMNAAKGIRVGNKSLRSKLTGALFQLVPYFPLMRNGELLYEPDEIDIRRVVIRGNGIPRARGKINTPWESEIRMVYDAVLVDERVVARALVEAGLRTGLLDYRPERGGSFGRFDVVECWTEDLS